MDAMSMQTLVILTGLVLAACGHLLVHNLLGAATAWNWVDGRFPPAWRSAPPVAGAALLVFGALGVLVPALG
jgi:hypothetical protein